MEKLDHGTYGRCDVCGEPIPEGRPRRCRGPCSVSTTRQALASPSCRSTRTTPSSAQAQWAARFHNDVLPALADGLDLDHGCWRLVPSGRQRRVAAPRVEDLVAI